MMKKLLIAVLALGLVGCSNVHKDNENRVVFTRTYSSSVHLPISLGDTQTVPLKLEEQLVLAISPKAVAQVRGTFKEYRPKITLTYSIVPVGRDSFVFSYSGSVDYLSYLDIKIYNGQQKIGGTTQHTSIIDVNSKRGQYGRPVHVALTDGIAFDFEVDRIQK